LVPLVRRWSIAAGYFDAPGDRKIHREPISRLGGVAMYLAFMLAVGAVTLLNGGKLPTGNGIPGLLLGSSVIFVLGLLDDVRNLSPYVKLGGQILAAVIAFYCGVQINALDLPGSQVLILNAFSFPITLMWMVGISNALNFIDGVDGLAGGVTTLSAVTLAVVALFTHQPVVAMFAAMLAGSSLGFLIFNLHPARIFMGDSGALFCGFTLASIAVTGVLKTQIVVMLLPVLVLSVPILDITYSTLRRVFRGQNPFIADADHLHHRLLKAGFSQTHTVYTFYVVCLIAGMLASNYVHSLSMYLVWMGSLLLLTFLLLALLRRGDRQAQAPVLPEEGESSSA
jgi:UDP-GlcNAc:undecaprenyl-phosphate GlcNAc-1-phosphate transferase